MTVVRGWHSESSLLEIIKVIFKQGWPFALSRLLFMSNSFIITLLLTQYNSDYLPATTLITSGQLFLLSVAISIMYSIAIKVGINYGKKDITQIRLIFRAGIIQALIISVPVIIICLIAKTIYIHFGQDSNLSNLSQIYFSIMAWGILPCLIINAIQQVFIGLGNSKLVLYSTILNTSLFCLTGYLLVNGVVHFGEVEISGIAGIGYAFVISSWINLLVGILYCIFYESWLIVSIKDPWFKLIREINGELRSLFSLGLFIGLQIFSELVTVITVTVFAGILGVLSLNQITDQYLATVVVISFAIAQTIGALVGKELGANNVEKAKKIGIAAILISLGFSLIVSLTFFLFGKGLASLFTKNQSLVSAATTLFLINGIGIFADNLRNIITGVLRGYKSVMFATISNSFSMMLLTLPLAYFLGFNCKLGLTGIYSARVIGMILGATLVLSFYYFKLRAVNSKVKVFSNAK